MRKHFLARRSGALLGLLFTLTLPWHSAAEPLPDLSAQERLQQALATALERDAAAAIRTGIASRRSSVQDETRASGPIVEWQTEGLEAGGEDATGAVHSLRLSKETLFPSQRRRSVDYQRQSEAALDALQQVELLELVATVGRDWLDYAASLELQSLAEHRLERLERALSLHRERLRLGEVAGAEVRQLELQKAQDSAELTRLGLRLDELAARLRLRTGDTSLPETGDLLTLASQLPDLSRDVTNVVGPQTTLAEANRLASEGRSQWVRRTAWGLPELEVESQRFSGHGEVPSFETFGWRIAVPLPIGARGRARRAAAEAAAASQRARSQYLADEIDFEVHRVHRRARDSQTMLEQLVPVAESLAFTERSLAEQFRLGAITYLIYIDGLSRLDELRSDLLQTRLTMLKARLELATMLADDTFFPIPPID